MAWNEPGGGNRDPWNNKGGDQGPPDLDEVVRKLQDKIGGLFGGKGGGSGGGNDGNAPRGSGGKTGGKLILAVAVVVGVIAAAADSFYIIEPAERGVVQRFGAYHEVVGPGLHFKLPLIDTYTPVNVDQVNKFVHRAQMLTRDENIADVTVEVQFRINDAADFLFQDANPGKTIHGAMESALREVIGKSDLDDIITANRSAISIAVQRNTQELLDLYRPGLIVTNINIQDAQPPEAVRDAFADAIKAREDNVRVQNQAEAYANDVVPRARGSAARLVEDAKAYKAKVVAEADGESQRFLKLLAEYKKAPKVTQERLYLETMQEVLANTGKVLLDTESGNNLTYLPLDRIVPGSSGSRSMSSGSNSISTDSSINSFGSGSSGVSQTSRDVRNAFSRDRGGRP